MKIRTGFVTNSSSSSFIIALEHTPSSPDDLRKMLFGEKKYIRNKYLGMTLNTTKISEIVFRNIMQQIDIVRSKENLLDEINMGECLGNFDVVFPKRPKTNEHSVWKEYYNKYDAALDLMHQLVIEDFIINAQGSFICVLEYCDNVDEIQAFLEHSGIFKNVKHIVVNKH